MLVDSHICPECRAGKHQNCDGRAWCVVIDELVPCSCEIHRHPKG